MSRALSALLAACVLLPACSQDKATAEALRSPIDCVAPLRKEPSLDSNVISSATFEVVQQDVGEAKNAEGKTVVTYIQHIVEKAQLPDDVQLEISLGGCEYYANVYDFSLPRTGRAPTETAFWLGKAAELIGQIEPAVKDPRINLSALQKELQRRAGDKAAPAFEDQAVQGVVPVAAPDAKIQHHYQVKVDERADRAKVTVQYAVGPL